MHAEPEEIPALLPIWRKIRAAGAPCRAKRGRKMDIYTVLLVDDEEEVMQAIMKKIDWEELGFSVIGYANSSVKALEMVEESQPDVVMTDIMMPYMDGIELATKIKEELPTTRIMFLTGFDKFEYAKEAIRLEAEEYILKPVNSAELTEVFTRLRAKMDREISEKRNVETLQNYYMESLPLLRADFYASLIEGRVAGKDLGKRLLDYQIEFKDGPFCCLIIHTSSGHVPEGMTPLLLDTAVRKQAVERFERNWDAKCFAYQGNTVLIVQPRDEREASLLTDECDRFCKYARRIIGATVTIGIGKVCPDILDLPSSYESAKEAVSYRVVYGVSKAINISEIAPQQESAPRGRDDSYLGDLLKAIRLEPLESIKEAVDSYFGHVLLVSQSPREYQIAVLDLIGALYRFSANNGLESHALSGDVGTAYNKLLDLDQESFRKWLTDVCVSLREELANARSQSAQSLVSRAKEYVSDHYADEDLSLNVVCRSLHVSNAYFSTVFKRETGATFVTYLTEHRMKIASRLLIETSEKSYVIARKVGYADPNYFSYVFKRHFGASPSKYRMEHLGSERT